MKRAFGGRAMASVAGLKWYRSRKGFLVSKYFSREVLSVLALLTGAVLGVSTVNAQTSTEVDVEGYLCRKAVDAEKFQQLASTSGDLSRAAALKRFNRDAKAPRCKWYERTLMIFKGALRQQGSQGEDHAKDLFVGGKGGVFEVLVYETPDGSQTLYSWRRTEGEAG